MRKMIEILPSSCKGDSVLVGSDLRDPVAARNEVEDWAVANGYQLPRNGRHLSIYDNGCLRREWVFAEPARPAKAPRRGIAALLGRVGRRDLVLDRAA